MQVGITTTNQLKRQKYLIDTVRQFEELGYDIYLNMDDGTKGIRVNKYECLMNAGKLAIEKNTGLLWCEDDIKLCKNFGEIIKDLSGKELFYCLFNFVSFGVSKEIAGKCFYSDGRLKVITGGKQRNEQIVYIHKDRVKEFLDMYKDFYEKKEMLRENYKMLAKHPDLIITKYFIENNIKITTTYPNLAQHIGMVSGVGNKIRKGNFTDCFLDDLEETVALFNK